MDSTSVARRGGGGGGGGKGPMAPPPPPIMPFRSFVGTFGKFVDTRKPTSMSFVPTKYPKYQQNIERNNTLVCKNAKIF